MIVLLVTAVSAYFFIERTIGSSQTSTATAYQIDIKPLNQSMNALAGSAIQLLFNVTSPRTGPLYFYASEIPEPGSHWNVVLQNVTSGNIKLPPGVQVSYPTGQAVFGTNHAILVLRVAFSSAVNGTVGLVVGVLQQANPDQEVGAGSAVYISVRGT